MDYLTEPVFVEPQLATLADGMPDGEQWVFENKFDGYRMLALIGDDVHLVTRNNVDWTRKFSGIRDSLKRLTCKSAVLDGEVVSMTAAGVSNFEKLHDNITADRQEALTYCIFDILMLDGSDLRALPLLDRKEKLERLLKGRPTNLVYSEHFPAAAVDLKAICARGLEGVMAKVATAPYAEGRTKDWLKVKCHKRQELVIGGFTEPTHANRGIGAILLGYFEGDVFRYAGKVGTGFDHDSANELRRRLEPLRVKQPAFDEVPKPIARIGVFTEPKLVCEIEFTEWTADGRLRHPSFQGIREDKPARDVHRDVELHVRAVEKP